MTKSASRAPCSCGSGKRFNRCCKGKEPAFQDLITKISTGQLPFAASIESTDGSPSSMVIQGASITIGGRETVLIDDKVILATNSADGDRTRKSAASISIPTDGLRYGSIRTAGNATVTNETAHPKISLVGNQKKIKANSESGLFVIARIGLQHDTQIPYFDILFGVKGQSEDVNEEGRKQRPHLALFPDGNGKFIRLDGHDCSIENEMHYHSGLRKIAPSVLRINSNGFKEVAEISFSTVGANEVVLNDIRFIV